MKFRPNLWKTSGLALIGLVLVDLAFGDWIPPNYGKLEIKRDELRHYDVGGMYPGGGITTFRTDEHGFRGKYGKPSDIDLLLIGNGTTIEQYVTEGKTWADHLRQNFARNGHRISIAAAGHHGQTSRGLIKRFDVWFPLVPGLRPRYILAYIGSNENRLDVATYYDAMVSPKKYKRIKSIFKNASVFYGLLRKLRRLVRGNKPTKLGISPEIRKRTWHPVANSFDIARERKRYRAKLADYRVRVGMLIERIKEFGSIPIIVSQHLGLYRIINGVLYGESGARAGFHRGTYSEAMVFSETAMAVCRETESICIDMVTEMEFSEDSDIYDHVHTGPTGNRKIADFLYGRLKDVIREKPGRL